MNILAIETATEYCSVALQAGTELLGRHQHAPREHASLLLPWVEQLLAEAQLSLNQLDAIAYGRGPGSFTSLRLGIGAVQGLAYGADLGVCGVSSLAALAQSWAAATPGQTLLVATDARMQEVYTGCYQVVDGGLEQLRDKFRRPGFRLPQGLPEPRSAGFPGIHDHRILSVIGDHQEPAHRGHQLPGSGVPHPVSTR